MKILTRIMLSTTLFIGVASGNIPNNKDESHPISKPSRLVSSFSNVRSYWKQTTFSLDADDDDIIDATILVDVMRTNDSETTAICNFLDKQGQQRLLFIIKSTASDINVSFYIKTRNVWVSESDHNPIPWRKGLISFRDDIGGSDNFLKIQNEFLRKIPKLK